MSRTLTSADRSALIRLASTLPVGSEERRAILAGLSRVAKNIPDNAPDWIKSAKPSRRNIKVDMYSEDLGDLEFDLLPSEVTRLQKALDKAEESDDWGDIGDNFTPWLQEAIQNKRMKLEFTILGGHWDMVDSPDGDPLDLAQFTRAPDQVFKKVVDNAIWVLRN